MTGLIISTRQREVWTHENKRHLDRLCKMLLSAEVTLLLRCANPVCPDQKITMVRDQTDPGGRILQCGCKNRFFETRSPGRKH